MNYLKKGYYYLLKIKNRLTSGRPVLVLMYHRVNDFSQGNLSHLTVSTDNFKKQLQLFHKNYQVLDINEEWTGLKKTGIVITFDDGYADNLINALPILEQYNIPATIFVATENIETNEEFWWDRLQFDYQNCSASFLLPDGDIVKKEIHSYGKLSESLSLLTKREKEIWLKKFEDINQISFYHRLQNYPLNISQLKKLSEHPLITIGLHSHSHRPFSNLSFEEQKEDLLLNIAALDNFGVKFTPIFALPHGAYNKETQNAVNALHLKSVFLANNYYSNNSNKLSRKINRILMPSLSGKKLLNYLNYFDF